MKHPTNQVEVISFRTDLAADFERLNRRWIEQYFVIEPADIEVLTEPYQTIIVPGGEIFFVIENGKPCGTCAVMRHDSSLFELAKMAVDPAAQGRGYGDLLIKRAIEFAHERKAEKLMLLTHSSLGTALHLYEKHGFKRVPVSHGGHYSRAEVEMELKL